eukprot:TRINITY_DN29728_c0_g1_i2.p1 TRINITY_DN29728_c0_g1~~TRINITY_DN29728_c0_g1_i2.p1  ORF type:complete len:284 (+),score=27.14 TRINITY_DN29728_c0_g1_i2:42-854(+)
MQQYVIFSGYYPAALAAITFFVLDGFLKLPPFKSYYLTQFRKNKSLKENQLDKVISQFSSRVVGAAHNIIQIPLSLYVLQEKKLWENTMHNTSTASEFLVMISCGFFLHDLVMCLMRVQEDGVQFFLHGLACCTAYTFGCVTGLMHWYGAAFLMWELSTPFLHLRWILYKLGLQETKIYFWNGVLLFVSFFFARNVFGLWTSKIWFDALIKEVTHPHEGSLKLPILIPLSAANICLNILNFFWFYKLCRVAFDVFVKKESLTKISEGKEE